jgi:hypothetical protein
MKVHPLQQQLRLLHEDLTGTNAPKCSKQQASSKQRANRNPWETNQRHWSGGRKLLWPPLTDTLWARQHSIG